MYIRYVLCFLATPLSEPATIFAYKFCAAAGKLSAETVHHDFVLICAGIFKQSVGARNQVGIGLSYRPARLRRAGGIDSLELIHELL
jgi:hypothetical protein